MAPRSLAGNSAWNIAGIVVQTLSQWTILIVLAKAGSTAMVGQVSLGLAIATPVYFVANLGLRQVLATDAKIEYAPRLYLKLRLVTSAVGLAVIALVGPLLSSTSVTLHVVLLMGLAKGFDAISELCYGLFQRIERLDYVGRSLILRGLSSVAVVAICLDRTGSIEIAVAGWAIVWALVAVGHDLRLYQRNSGARSSDRLTVGALSLVRLSLPLGLAGMLVALNLNMPRYYLAHFHGESLLGFFAAAAYIPISGRRFLEAVGQAATPRLASFWAADRHASFRSLLARLIALGAACGGVGILVVAMFGGTILAVVYTDEYASHSGVFLLLMVSWSLRYPGAFLTGGLVAARRFNRVPLVFLPSLVAAVIGGAVLIPRYGIAGAAWADMVSAILQLAITAWLGRSLFARRPAS